jgi:OOP family OmpA-OmpF porin
MSGAPVHAQSSSEAPIQMAPEAKVMPYAVDSSGTVVRSGQGACWRTGSWTLADAASAPVKNSPFPVGCSCEPDLMPAGACVAPPAAPVPAPMAETPPPAPAPAAGPQVEKVSIPADTTFAFDSAKLTDAGQATLRQLVQRLQGVTIEAVVATGHTDRIGTPAYNMKLSERRADAVKAFLVEAGLPADHVYAEGKGEADPVTGQDCAHMGKERGSNKALVTCLAPDRRVVIEAVGTRTTAP